MRDVEPAGAEPAGQASGQASGAQWSIGSAGHVAVIVQVGGGLRSYEVDGRAIVAGYDPDEVAPGAAGQVLAPWPNRIRDGRYTFAGRSYQLDLSEPATQSAIHGLVRWLPWRRVAGSADSVTVECFLPAHPGYPWPLLLRTGWSVGPDGLHARHEVTNLGAVPAPFGLGAHPYLVVPGKRADDLALSVPAGLRLLLDGRKLPIGAAKINGGSYDYRRGRPLAGERLDMAFGDVDRDADGRSTVRLDAVDGSGAVAIWADASFGWWQVYTGDTLAPERARRSVAVEPMTCPPDAFRSRRDVVPLEPGRTWRGSWGIRPWFAGHEGGDRRGVH